jgi:hypothetical protein
MTPKECAHTFFGQGGTGIAPFTKVTRKKMCNWLLDQYKCPEVIAPLHCEIAFAVSLREQQIQETTFTRPAQHLAVSKFSCCPALCCRRCSVILRRTDPQTAHYNSCMGRHVSHGCFRCYLGQLSLPTRPTRSGMTSCSTSLPAMFNGTPCMVGHLQTAPPGAA